MLNKAGRLEELPAEGLAAAEPEEDQGILFCEAACEQQPSARQSAGRSGTAQRVAGRSLPLLRAAERLFEVLRVSPRGVRDCSPSRVVLQMGRVGQKL